VSDEIVAAGGVAMADTHDAMHDAGGIVASALGAFGGIDLIVAMRALRAPGGSRRRRSLPPASR
jgi:hypothetical protein